MSTSSSASSGRYSPTFTPLVTICTAVPTVVTLAPNSAAWARSTFMRHSMPGNERVSSMSRIPSTFASIHSRTRATAGSRSAASREANWSWIGLPTGGPGSNSCTSTRMPARSAVRRRISSRIASPEVSRRLRSCISRNSEPMRSNDTLEPRKPEPEGGVVRVFTLSMPAMVTTSFSTSSTRSRTSSAERLPRAWTLTSAKMGSRSLKNTKPRP